MTLRETNWQWADWVQIVGELVMPPPRRGLVFKLNNGHAFVLDRFGTLRTEMGGPFDAATERQLRHMLIAWDLSGAI